MTKVPSELKTIRLAFEKSRPSKARKHKEQLAALQLVADSTSISPVVGALNSMRNLPGACVYRRELLNAMARSISVFTSGEAGSLEEAAWLVRNRTRQLGRIMPNYALGTTLLVKGLECDHVIVLDADALDTENLYVAMTRGARSLTIVSANPILQPKRAS